MTWLKRNLVLVVGGLVALALLGLTGFYLYTQYGRASTITTDLENQIKEFKRLTTRDPSATTTNIELARVEQKRLGSLLDETRKSFAPVAAYTNIDSAAFKALLETTIFELQQTADREGVRTPERFSYTFKSQRDTVVFDQKDLLPWTYQLLELKALCETIYRARVHSLVSVRRVPISRAKDLGSTDFLSTRKPVTNAVTSAVSSPYEVVFQGFSGELANVLDGLVRSPHCFIVKNVNVDKVGAAGAAGTEESEAATPGYTVFPGATEGPAAAGPASTADLMMRRYGVRPGSRSPADMMRQRYGGTPGGRPGEGVVTAPPVVTPATPVRRGPVTVLDERLLKFTMLIDVVRLGTLPK